MSDLQSRLVEESWSLDEIAAATEEGLLFVAHRGAALAGFALCRRAADEAEILSLAVEPAARRLGLGRALIATALESLRGAGARRVFLEVAEDNAPATRLYAGCGFRRVGRRAGYYRGRTDAVVMRADL